MAINTSTLVIGALVVGVIGIVVWASQDDEPKGGGGGGANLPPPRDYSINPLTDAERIAANQISATERPGSAQAGGYIDTSIAPTGPLARTREVTWAEQQAEALRIANAATANAQPLTVSIDCHLTGRCTPEEQAILGRGAPQS